MENRQEVLIKKLINLHPLNTIKNIISPKEKIYLVGGSIRDFLLGKRIKDFDLITNKNPFSIVKRIAKSLNGKFFKFKDFNYRIIYKENHIVKNIDFSRFIENTLLKNLNTRDFTINALALEVNNPCFIDPCNGIKDLTQKTLRVINSSSFVKDPLRLLRAIRLSAQLKFKIEDKTRESITKLAPLIKEVSREGILNELCLILKNKKSFYFLKQLYELDLLIYIIPEFAFFYDSLFNSQEIWLHSLNSLKELENILENLSWYFPEYHKKIKQYLRKKQVGNRNNLVLLKLAIFLHDIGKPLTKSLDKKGKFHYTSHQEVGKTLAHIICKHLSLSNQEIECLTQTIKHHMQIGYFSNCNNLSSKALWRFYKKIGSNLVNIVLLSLADSKETYSQEQKLDLKKHQGFSRDLLQKYFEKDKDFYPKTFINGNDLIKYFNLSPGPIFKTILNEAIFAHIDGKIKNKKEALKYIELKYNLQQSSILAKAKE
ncbi:MAG: HD domain-containing protein [bacterium]|nr:HD domain-containing protein [bacterium]